MGKEKEHLATQFNFPNPTFLKEKMNDTSMAPNARQKKQDS
jgi:hypothetical protein